MNSKSLKQFDSYPMKSFFIYLVTLISFLLVFPSLTKADILFFDLNFAITELKAARQLAKERGEKLLIYPERTLEDERNMAPQWLLTEELMSRRTQCFLEGHRNCEEIEKKAKEAQKVMEKKITFIHKIDSEEFNNIIKKTAGNSKISMVIFSGHSGGTSFGGLLGLLSFADVRVAWDQNPQILSDLKTVLLWGCYSGTFNSLYNQWKKSFPSIPLFAGYEKRSPLGIRESSAQYMTSLVHTEGRLLKARSLKEAHKIFKTIHLVAALDGTALLGDNYLTYDEADGITEMLKRCQEFPIPLYEQFQCFDEGKSGCENPAPDHQGPLRDFYTYLQINRHCSDLIRDKYPQIPTPDYLIRLIYIDNIKSNFGDHHQEDISNYKSLLLEEHFPMDFAAENFLRTNRSKNVKLQSDFSNEMLRIGALDGSIFESSQGPRVFQIQFANAMLMRSLNMPTKREGNFTIGGTETESCIPFGWVDLGSTERDQCYFDRMVQNPLPLNIQKELESTIVLSKFFFELYNINPALLIFLETFDLSDKIDSKEKLKSKLMEQLKKNKEKFNGKEEFFPPHFIERMEAMEKIMIQLESLNPDQFLEKTLKDLDFITQFFNEKLAAQESNSNETVKYVLKYLITQMTAKQKLFLTLN